MKTKLFYHSQDGSSIIFKDLLSRKYAWKADRRMSKTFWYFVEFKNEDGVSKFKVLKKEHFNEKNTDHSLFEFPAIPKSDLRDSLVNYLERN